MEKTEIKKLVLEIGGKEMTVSVADAKKLHEALTELFGKKTEQIFWPVYRDRWIERSWRYWEPYYCGSSTQRTDYSLGMNQQSTNVLKMSII